MHMYGEVGTASLRVNTEGRLSLLLAEHGIWK
jgi:hypothetical protein